MEENEDNAISIIHQILEHQCIKYKKNNQPMNRREMLGNVAKGVAVGAAALITSCHTNEPEPTPTPEPTPECHPTQLPNPTITHETEPGKNDGIIKNPSNYPMEISQTKNFSTGNFTLQPEATKEALPAGDYYARWAPNGTCPVDSRIANITIAKGITPPPPPIDIEGVTPYTEGSNQEWALWALAQLDKSEEKIRLYNYLVKAFTYVQIHDKNDYLAEYDEGKALMESQLQNTTNETTKKILQLALNDKNWLIYCKYPVEKPFQLTHDEIRQVCEYLHYGNHQFFLEKGTPRLFNSDNGQSIGIMIPAYYALAERRQQTHEKILNGFEKFKSNLEKAKVDINNRYEVAKYVYDDITKTLVYDEQIYPDEYIPFKMRENRETILGYFDNSKVTICEGYSRMMAYFQNRLNVPTIYQDGIFVLDRDTSGNIISSGPHAWNAAQMENNKWYFQDATADIRNSEGNYQWFLKGQGTVLTEKFTYSHIISEDRLYPECSIEDYPIPVRSMQAPALATSSSVRR